MKSKIRSKSRRTTALGRLDYTVEYIVEYIVEYCRIVYNENTVEYLNKYVIKIGVVLYNVKSSLRVIPFFYLFYLFYLF
jgi:hypothetical protein